jgi:thiol peroxidase
MTTQYPHYKIRYINNHRINCVLSNRLIDIKEDKMTTVTLKGNPVNIAGSLPAVGSKAPSFTLTTTDLSDVTLSDFSGKKIILNIFPSVDTPTCAMSVRKFNQTATAHPDTIVLCISADLPFAQARFCGAEGLSNIKTLSTFRHPEFAQQYGVKFDSGPLVGLTARAVVIIGVDGKVTHTELVAEVSHEPDYDAALAAL